MLSSKVESHIPIISRGDPAEGVTFFSKFSISILLPAKLIDISRANVVLSEVRAFRTIVGRLGLE